MKTVKFDINKWLCSNIQDRLYWYKSAFAAGRYSRSKRECLVLAANITEQDINADVFLLSL